MPGKKLKEEFGREGGKKYRLVHDKLGRQRACDPDFYNEWWWFLWIENDYAGYFLTKKDAIAFVRKSGDG